jgi:hypothetical protein
VNKNKYKKYIYYSYTYLSLNIWLKGEVHKRIQIQTRDSNEKKINQIKKGKTVVWVDCLILAHLPFLPARGPSFLRVRGPTSWCIRRRPGPTCHPCAPRLLHCRAGPNCHLPAPPLNRSAMGSATFTGDSPARPTSSLHPWPIHAVKYLTRFRAYGFPSIANQSRPYWGGGKTAWGGERTKSVPPPSTQPRSAFWSWRTIPGASVVLIARVGPTFGSDSLGRWRQLLAVGRTWTEGCDHRGQLVGAHNFRYDFPRMRSFGSSQCLAPVGLVVRARKLGICLADDGAAVPCLRAVGRGGRPWTDELSPSDFVWAV